MSFLFPLSMLFPTMHAECGFHTQVAGRDLLVATGPIIQVVISFDPSKYPPGDKKSSVDFQALIDTGAKDNYIDVSVAKALNLPIVNQRTLSGSNGKHTTDVYLAQIYVPDLNEVILGQFAGVKLIDDGMQHGALLGRAFLKNMIMHYNGLTGQVTLTKQ